MNKALHKILAGLIVLLFVPVGSFVFYEYTKMSDNEKMINSVYKNQLESIVISLNSYAQDVAGNWASRIELSLRYQNDTSILNKLTSENPAITAIYLVPEGDIIQQMYPLGNPSEKNQQIRDFLKSQSKSIHQLLSYFKSNYRKFQSFSNHPDSCYLYFICHNEFGKPVVCLINLNQSLFFTGLMRSRMQAIAEGHFIISLIYQPTGDILLSTEKNISNLPKFDQEGEMWLFPQTKIGISLKTQTITDLATKRLQEGLILIGMVFLVLLAGVWFLYSSVKREIQLAQIKSEFISNVSHEIRTPLALISMYIETLEMGRVKTQDKVHEYYQIIGKETQRLTAMVNKILSFSKMENGKRQFNCTVSNLNTITSGVLETYEFHFKSKDFTYSFNPDQNIVNGCYDQEAVADAIINLIDNAIKYSRDKRQIEIRTGLLKKMAWVEVRDYGLGISKKNQKLVFDKFYRVTNENLANEVKGTGLGLAIVAEIVKAHKGKITLQSKPGEGSTFRLYFPIIQQNIKAI